MIPFVGICSGGPLDGQKMARGEAKMDIFEPAYGPLGEDDPLPDFAGYDWRVAGHYEYLGYCLWSWVPR